MNISRKDIPRNPGVYFFKNDRGEIIYIGKAKNLRNRVMSYFSNKHDTSPKTQILVKNIADFEFIVVDNELESFLLENKLIKKHKPKYNITLKDAKTYAYIKITDEEIPKILITRKVTQNGWYFGPYTDGQLRNKIYNLVVDIFMLITPKTFASKSKLYYEVGKAPSKNIDDINKKEYLKQVERAKKFLEGKNVAQIKKELKNAMEKASFEKQFERALYYKQQLETIESIKEKQKVDLVKQYDQDVIAHKIDFQTNKIIIMVFHIGKGVISSKKEYSFDYDENIFLEFIKMLYSKQTPPREILVDEKIWEKEEERNNLEKYFSRLRGSKTILHNPQKGEKKRLVELAHKNLALNSRNLHVLKEMKEKLNLSQSPSIIECFDMSNLGNEDIVGGMTRWVDGKPDKEGYRKFEIKSSKGKQDDFAAMRETIYRRYHRLKYQKQQLPDLILIDGGKGQLGMGVKALREVGVDIPIISIAKKDEEIFVPDKQEPLIFDKNSPMMLLIREMRDSVHNYVVTYNRKKRQMRMRNDFREISKQNK